MAKLSFGEKGDVPKMYWVGKLLMEIRKYNLASM
jgi:hypothetical protein